MYCNDESDGYGVRPYRVDVTGTLKGKQKHWYGTARFACQRVSKGYTLSDRPHVHGQLTKQMPTAVLVHNDRTAQFCHTSTESKHSRNPLCSCCTPYVDSYRQRQCRYYLKVTCHRPVRRLCRDEAQAGRLARCGVGRRALTSVARHEARSAAALVGRNSMSRAPDV